jgi:hypothetical protein
MASDTATEMGTVTLTQYMRPRGNRVEVRCDVPAALAKAAENMALSCEVLMGGQVVIYGRWNDEDEDAEHMEFASNAPGDNQPDKVTARVITKVLQRRPVSS